MDFRNSFTKNEIAKAVVKHLFERRFDLVIYQFANNTQKDLISCKGQVQQKGEKSKKLTKCFTVLDIGGQVNAKR